MTDDDASLAREPKALVAPPGYRTCAGPCGRMLPRGAIYRSGWCRECEPLRVAEYRASRRDDPAWRQRQHDYNAAYWQANKEHLSAEARAYRHKKREERKAATAERRERGMLTLREAAAAIGVAHATLVTQVHNKAITVVRDGRWIYVREDEAARYRKEQKGKPGRHGANPEHEDPALSAAEAVSARAVSRPR